VTVVSEIGGIIGSTLFVVFAGAIVILNGFDSDGSSLEFWPVFSVIIVVESAEVLFVAVVTFVFLGVGFTFYSWEGGKVMVFGWVYPLPGIVLNQMVNTNLPETIAVDWTSK
jgi:hypothetical protein